MKTGRVFDSWAILAYAQDEPAADLVENLLLESSRLQNGWISSMNLGEVWYTLARRRSHHVADQHLITLAEIGLQRIDADWPLVLQAADFKSRHKISYVDAVAAALAKQRDAELVTGDPDFRSLDSEISIYWL